MNSYDQYCPIIKQKCATPYECANGCHVEQHLYKEKTECCNGNCNEGRDCPKRISMVMRWKDTLADLLCTFVWWSGVIGLVALVAVTAGLFFGFFL